MNIDPRFKSDGRNQVSLPEPIRLGFPDWLPWRGIVALGIATAIICAPFLLWWDLAIANTFAAFRDDAWVGAFRTLTAAGNSAFWYTPAVLGFIAALWVSRQSPDSAASWEWRRRARSILFVIVSMMMSGTIVNVLKITFGRHRPRFFFNEGVYGFEPFMLDLRSAGFPSGHTQSITAAMVALGFLWPKGRWVFWGFALVVASSRFIITVHYAADVIAGAFVAIAVAWALKRYYERNGIPLAWARS
ncbi:MAG: phosphatase PAP2 family protein [Rhodospirillaceae bacterium]|nr:phosphatase PAP2 family protein [Rhodospirillaceae bacterium]